MKTGSMLKTAAAGYLKQKRFLFATLAIMAVIFYLVIALYKLDSAPVLYASALSCTVGIIALVCDFILYYRKHLTLTRLLSTAIITLDGLPEGKNFIEEDYNALIRLLYDEKQRIAAANSRASADMTEYYTIWAHQIKTPIAAIELMLQSGNLDGPALRAEVFKIEQYVEMVMCYLRLETTATDYVLKEYALDPIIRQVIRKFARMFILKDIKLEYDGIAEQKLTDEKWLAFVIEQVLSNAIKYTNEGKVSIYMQDGQLVIEDTGIGIDEGDLPQIFSRSYTGYNGRRDKSASGLGLYLSREILRRLSHTIRVESTLGVGTRIIIGFPDVHLLID